VFVSILALLALAAGYWVFDKYQSDFVDQY
jgi:ABC-type polysaccharide/polyol phosphate export permease